MSPSAAVLAGGVSSRLGFPKALLRLGTGRTLIEDTVRKLRRLSDEFELCGVGLNRVRREWEAMASQSQSRDWDARRN